MAKKRKYEYKPYKELYKHQTEEERRTRLKKQRIADIKWQAKRRKKLGLPPIKPKDYYAEWPKTRSREHIAALGRAPKTNHFLAMKLDPSLPKKLSINGYIKVIKFRLKQHRHYQRLQIKYMDIANKLKEERKQERAKEKQVLKTRRPNWGETFDPQTGLYATRPGLPKYYPVHKFQDIILKSDVRFTGAIAGTGGGKTVIGPLWCLDKIQKAIEKYGKCLGMIVAPTYKVLSRATMPCFVETLQGTALEGEYLESKSYYRLPNNWGRIWAQGADNPGGLEGGQFDFVWGDEGGQFRKKTFDALTGRTGAKMAPLLITTTPYGLGAIYKEWVKPFLAGDKDYFIVHWSSKENPGYPDEEYERAKRSMTPEKFAERYDGQFTKLEGLVYPEFQRCIIQMTKTDLDELLATSGGRHIGGIDFGWNDPFCALGGFLTPVDDILYIWYERYRSQKTIEEHANHLPKFPSMIWHADHVPESIKKLRRGGFTVRNAKKDILPGIYAVNRRIYTGKLKVISNRAPATIAEAETYVYPEKDEEIVGDVPVDRDNHAMDTLRYLVMGLDWRKPA